MWAGTHVAAQHGDSDPWSSHRSTFIISGEFVMQEGNRSQSQNRDSQGRQSQAHLTSLALRSIGQVYDMNLSAARVLLQTQARAASALGLPDWSGLFNSVDVRARHVFS